MLALNQVGRVLGHVVAQVVETELVVGAEGNVGQICTAAALAIGLVLVDAIHAEAMEHVDGTHPLGVALCQIVVHGYHVHTVAGKGIEEDGQGGGKGLTLTSEHLGNLALMQDGTAEELYVKVHHGPLHVVAASYPVVVVDGSVAIYVHEIVPGGKFAVEIGCLDTDVGTVGEALGCALYDGEHLGTHLVQSLFQNVKNLLLQFVYLLEEGSTVLNLCLWDAFLDFRNLLAQRGSLFCYLLADFMYTGTQFVIAQSLYLGICIQYGLYQGAVCLQVARLLVAEKFN